MAVGDKKALPLAVCGKIPDADGNITLSVEEIDGLVAALSNKANADEVTAALAGKVDAAHLTDAKAHIGFYRALGQFSAGNLLDRLLADGKSGSFHVTPETAGLPLDSLYWSGSIDYGYAGRIIVDVVQCNGSGAGDRYYNVCIDRVWKGWIGPIATMADLAGKEPKQWMPANWKTEADPPSAYPDDSTTSFFGPNGGAGFGGINQPIVTTYKHNNNAIRQEVSFLGGTGVRYRVGAGNDSWGKWEEFATATPPQEIDFPLAAGARIVYDSTCRKAQDSTAVFNIAIGAVDGGQIANNQVFATLPPGYRPKSQRLYPAVAIVGANQYPGLCSANIDGSIGWVGPAIQYPGYIVSLGDFVAA